MVCDGQSHVKRTLDAIEAMLENRATLDQQSYTIAGRSLTRMSITDLLMWRDKYRAEYQREQDALNVANGLGTKRRLLTRFSS